MPEGTTNIAGIEIPSTDPIFLAVVGVHILLGLVCTITAPIAMLTQKRAGRHPRFGTCPHSRDVQSGPIAPANLLAVASHRRYSFNRSRSLVASAGAALKHTRPRPSFPHGKLGFFLGNGHGLRGIDSLLPANLMVRPEENLHGWRPQFSPQTGVVFGPHRFHGKSKAYRFTLTMPACVRVSAIGLVDSAGGRCWLPTAGLSRFQF